MNSTQDNHSLEHMLKLSKLGADGHKERRNLEFRIFVSYLTSLGLLLYQVHKPEDPILQETNGFWPPFIFSTALFFIHCLYCAWQRNIAIALINDVRRRDFYLLKAQCLSYHLSLNSNTGFRPRQYKKHWINMGGGKSDKISERCLFKKDIPKIIEEPSWKEFLKLWRDTHIWLQIGVPTIIVLPLMISIHKWSWIVTIPTVLILIGRLDGPDTICPNSRNQENQEENL